MTMEISKQSIDDVEAELIYRNKPEENDNGKNIYTGDTHLLTVTSSGDLGTLKSDITVL